MKTLLIAALSLVISTLGHGWQMTDEMRQWLDHQNELDEQRRANARQQDAIEDIQWELADQRRRAIENARIQKENARIREENARIQRAQQIAALRRFEAQQRFLIDEQRRQKK